MAQRRTIITGGDLVTMDPKIGVLRGGDVLIEDGTIVAVGYSIPHDDAEVIDASGSIVAPGLIDTHRHTWQTQMRALCADWTLGDYFFGIRLAVSPAYSAQDVKIGNQLGALEAIDAGVTTILDFSHCNNSPAHSDAALAGLQESGIRAIFGYGFFDSSPMAPQHFRSHAERVDDFERIASASFASPGLVRLGVSLTEPGIRPLSESRAEVEAARRHSALVVTHTGCVWQLPTGVAEMESEGMIDGHQVHVHCNALTDEEWAILARHGAKISISPETELNMGMGRLVFAKAAQHGLKPTLSADVMSLNSGDLFTQMRIGLAFARWAETEEENLRRSDPLHVTATAEDALTWTTVNAAEALGLADEIGSISVGKRADLILVGGRSIRQHPHIDPIGTLVFQTNPGDVHTVLIDGRVVKRDGTLVGVDLDALTAEADQSAENVLARVREVLPVLPGTPPDGFDALHGMFTANLATS